MWQVITTAATLTFFMRTVPVFFKTINRIYDYPKLNKFLDYTICFITGEIIYSVAFEEIPRNTSYLAMVFLSIATLALAGTVMWTTSSLMKSFIAAISVFIFIYYLSF